MNANSKPSTPGSAVAAGMIAQDELLHALNELLEAERAGARVARETAAQMQSGDLVGLVQDIQRDEVHWCSLLLRVIRAMQARPSDQTGAFYEKAMAIASIEDRLAFLNRGQAWVVRRLQQLIPRIADAQVQADLQEMLSAHERNIARVEDRLPPAAAQKNK